ncbi:MAG: carbamoyltransferase [Gammaproteobacteria bacterium]|nr:carbamoyltransferase [Gammaproteobacteria bacterium]
MSKAILGISAFYHDSAAALIVDGEIVAAAQEERFSRVKHDHRLPLQAIEYCLDHAGLKPEDLAHVGFYDKPLLKFERLLETYLAYAPRGFPSFLKAIPLWLKQKLYIPREIQRGLGGAYRKRLVFTEHHESHAASAFFPSPFEEAAVLTMDGVGEWATASFGVGRGNRLELSHELHFPHSLGLLYSAFTYFCGFRVNSGEYKLMGLAPYGEPRYADLILTNILDVKDDGSFRMDMSYFNYCQGLTMTSGKMEQLFNGPPRSAEGPLTAREMDIAASIQQVTEEIVLRMGRHVHAKTGMRNLCLAGGVALNCVANGRLLREGPFDDIWIQPAAGDAGGAIGVALFIWHQLLDRERHPKSSDSQSGSLLGPRFAEVDIQHYLDGIGAPYTAYDDDDSLCAAVADELATGKVVGWFQDRMEFGPRALGARSILGDARREDMQSVMNMKIKYRESFRPFAPSILEERAADYFEMLPGTQSPYMLHVAPISASKRSLAIDDEEHVGLDRLQQPHSEIPAVTHVDYSARVQTVDPIRHGRYRTLLEHFDAKTGCPILINTSFNIRGEPIVCTPQDAYRCFLATEMDCLVLEKLVLHRHDQPQMKTQDVERYKAQFKPD